ncbi:nuclear transport factor 2 family protein [Nocardioides bizhenqiangii]|uniref:Nuclear transport factor 2 family protein n=1 Tax=Nocardioides bizhenqiangii TaxID=3095076 RepID=A0ABZ0ZNL9_9ACTN|nr:MULTISPECIES: nuclear transport factor 2 family protein [unclassified Nocardioides]MDZ5621023.1 nuclear transport factor 2 family protein [Nocardioides sp. HM23]WQQ25379.1 nuclear transport factor 2 family protein [Nocardioides sp. HM61]
MTTATHDGAAGTDREQIEETLYRYASTIDTGDHESLRALLADDARAKYGARGWMEGADEVVSFIRDKSEEVGWQHHLLSIYHVDIDGDEATALTYHTSYQITRNRPDEAAMIVARYHDRLVRGYGRWLIREKRMEIGWRETRSGTSFL